MKYFIDTEFIEKRKTPIFGKPYHFLQLISIGIIAEDGRTYYAINKDYNQKEASQWVKDNVITKLESRYNSKEEKYYKSLKQIGTEIGLFMDVITDIGKYQNIDNTIYTTKTPHSKPEIYGYYSDYDWVVFCSIFGSMMELFPGLPMYCIDLKQTMDKLKLTNEWKKTVCPEPEDEHNALSDAIWTMNLYKEMCKAKPNLSYLI